MKRTLKYLVLALLPWFGMGCSNNMENPNAPQAVINFTIYPDTDIRYQALKVVSGWMYLTSDAESTSRGIIVYRLSQSEFLAYDRLPPNYPNACNDSQGNTTRLVVDYPFVIDQCNNAYYNILNGAILIDEENGWVPNFETQGVHVYPLIQYHTMFDGTKLTIYN